MLVGIFEIKLIVLVADLIYSIVFVVVAFDNFIFWKKPIIHCCFKEKEDFVKRAVDLCMTAFETSARLVYDFWTENGSREEGLADKFFDGSIDALASLLLTGCGGGGKGAGKGAHYVDAPVVCRRSAKEMTYCEFVDDFMRPNRPVVISNLTTEWASTEMLTTPEGEVDADALEMMFGDAVCPVHCTTISSRSNFGGVTRPVATRMTVRDYCSWWRAHHECDDCDDDCDDDDDGGGGDDDNDDERGPSKDYLYLKDWRFTRAFPSCEMYKLPIYFQEDWLNDFTGGNYKFIYLGPKNTSTRMHCDVLRSYSWSSNICGRKRWYLIPPEHTYLLYDVFNKALCPHLHFDLENELYSALYPGLERARKFALEIVQEAGETIFVPSGWHHTVENIEDTLSINHNWLNGYNLEGSWDKLKEELRWLAESRESVDGAAKEKGGDVVADFVLLYNIISHQLRDGCKRGERPDFLNDIRCMKSILTEIVEGIEGDYAFLKDEVDWDGPNLLSSLEETLKNC